MDRRIRQLQRLAASGDPEAELHLAYVGCRAGQHVLRDDQIILADNHHDANEDAGCCQCGYELYDSKQLCQMGHHRLRWDQWKTPLQYHCTRRRYNLEELMERINRGESPGKDNPYERFGGCGFYLETDECCKRGLHFLYLQAEGRVCQNPNCDYIEDSACKHIIGGRSTRNSLGQEVRRCSRCQRAFFDAEICQQWGHAPDPATLNPCIRPSCPAHHPGMHLYDALAASYKLRGKLEAICREHDGVGRAITIARAWGWNEKLKGYGIKKPRLSKEERSERAPRYRKKGWGSYKNPGHLYQVSVAWGGGYRSSQVKNYTEIKGNLKTRWNGNWYPYLGEPVLMNYRWSKRVSEIA